MKFIENLSNFHIYGFFFFILTFIYKENWVVGSYITCAFFYYDVFIISFVDIHTFPPVKFKREVFQLYRKNGTKKKSFLYIIKCYIKIGIQKTKQAFFQQNLNIET